MATDNQADQSVQVKSINCVKRARTTSQDTFLQSVLLNHEESDKSNNSRSPSKESCKKSKVLLPESFRQKKRQRVDKLTCEGASNIDNRLSQSDRALRIDVADMEMINTRVVER